MPVFSFLHKPYPYIGDARRDLRNNFFIGLFVALFLTFFQPFQINEWQTDFKVLKLFGFGFISFLMPTVINLVISKLGRKWGFDENWTILHEVLTILLVLLFIALGNMTYGKLLGVTPFSFAAFLIAFGITCLVGIFPVSLHVILKHNKLLQINLQESIAINEKLSAQHQSHLDENKVATDSENTINEPAMIVLVAENEKDKISFTPAQLLFIESADNYSTLVFNGESGKRKKQLLRSSLKRIENQLSDQNMVRCHRAYIVNLANVKHIEGNAAGYKLYFYEGEDCVPVSRNYVPMVGEKLRHLR